MRSSQSRERRMEGEGRPERAGHNPATKPAHPEKGPMSRWPTVADHATSYHIPDDRSQKHRAEQSPGHALSRDRLNISCSVAYSEDAPRLGREAPGQRRGSSPALCGKRQANTSFVADGLQGFCGRTAGPKKHRIHRCRPVHPTVLGLHATQIPAGTNDHEEFILGQVFDNIRVDTKTDPRSGINPEIGVPGFHGAKAGCLHDRSGINQEFNAVRLEVHPTVRFDVRTHAFKELYADISRCRGKSKIQRATRNGDHAAHRNLNLTTSPKESCRTDWPCADPCQEITQARSLQGQNTR